MSAPARWPRKRMYSHPGRNESAHTANTLSAATATSRDEAAAPKPPQTVKNAIASALPIRQFIHSAAACRWMNGLRSQRFTLRAVVLRVRVKNRCCFFAPMSATPRSVSRTARSDLHLVSGPEQPTFTHPGPERRVSGDRGGARDQRVEERLLCGVVGGGVFGMPLHREEPGAVDLEAFDHAVGRGRGDA